ncbi:hypothetical protein, partial [Dyella sp.]|uniref:hypothetical protein n=1 Tax=Dyella sp. TaxID=1869338 RepID=UPI0032177AF1
QGVIPACAGMTGLRFFVLPIFHQAIDGSEEDIAPGIQRAAIMTFSSDGADQKQRLSIPPQFPLQSRY